MNRGFLSLNEFLRLTDLAFRDLRSKKQRDYTRISFYLEPLTQKFILKIMQYLHELCSTYSRESML